MSAVCEGGREDLVRWVEFGSGAFPPGSHGRALENRFGFVARRWPVLGASWRLGWSLFRCLAQRDGGSAGDFDVKS